MIPGQRSEPFRSEYRPERSGQISPCLRTQGRWAVGASGLRFQAPKHELPVLGVGGGTERRRASLRRHDLAVIQEAANVAICQPSKTSPISYEPCGSSTQVNVLKPKLRLYADEKISIYFTPVAAPNAEDTCSSLA